MRGSYLTLVAAGATLLAGTAVAQDNNGRKFTVQLEGEQVTRPADPDGSATASLRINPGKGEVCYTLTARNIAPATAAHIHEGAPVTDGPVVVDFEPPTSGTSSGCTQVGREWRARPSSSRRTLIFVVHNAEFPAGALRGQMAR